MPANLPPQYFEAERTFRQARSAPEKIAALEEMLAIMPKHKGTDHLRAELRARIAKLNVEAEKKSGARRASMVILKEGAAQVAVTGLTNSGKSQLVASVTNASPLVADYPFVTRAATPGMMEFENIQIQLIDTPALAPQTIEYWLPPLLRRADALLVVVDLGADPLGQMAEVLGQLRRLRIQIMEGEPDSEQLVVMERKKALVAANKLDLPGAREQFDGLHKEFAGRLATVAISARDRTGLEDLKKRLVELLDIIRVYTKAPGEKPDLTNPIILPRGSTLEAAAASVHKDFAAKLKYARVWGSGKHEGVMVKRDHVLQDGDVIELHL